MDQVSRSILDKDLYWMAHPWTQERRPFRVVENIYFVGNLWVSSFLLDTSEGLILIDCGVQETFYLLVDSVRALGFDPHNIKKLFLTHGHFDHCAPARRLQEMSGCEIWVSKAEEFFFTQRRDLILCPERVAEFLPAHFYDYDRAMDFGSMVVQPVHCPGHTPGSTTFLIDTIHRGRKITCAIHGGLGPALISLENLQENGLPLSLRQDYLDSIDKVADHPVDVVLPSHPSHCVDYDFFRIADEDDGTGEGFIDPQAWRRMLFSKKAQMEQMIRDGI